MDIGYVEHNKLIPRVLDYYPPWISLEINLMNGY